MKFDTVFLVDSDANFVLPLETSLKATGFAVHFFSSVGQLLKWLPGHVNKGNAVIVSNNEATEQSTLLSVVGSKFPELQMILAVEKPCVRTAVDLMRRGASYVLHKPYSPEQLQRTLGEIAPPTEGEKNRETAHAGGDAVHQRLQSLSPRQKEILVNVFEGRINKVIAHRLGISIKTVELHRSRMMQKMQAASAVDLIKMTAPHSEELCKQASA